MIFGAALTYVHILTDTALHSHIILYDLLSYTQHKRSTTTTTTKKGGNKTNHIFDPPTCLCRQRSGEAGGSNM